MKKVTKLFLSVAAIGALAAGLATSAMAMTATYDAGTVTIVAEDGDKVASTEKTLLILNNDATTVTESDIVQIDQSEDIASVPVGELAEGTYYVRVGGDGNIDTATFTVGGAADRKVLVGDVDGNGEVLAGDASQVLLYTVHGDSVITEGSDAFYAAALCDGNNEILAADASQILLYTVHGDSHVNVNTEMAIPAE